MIRIGLADLPKFGGPTVGQDCQKCKETSNPLADKQQKKGEQLEYIKIS